MNPDDTGTETKPGVKTTEFWITILTNIGVILNLTNAWSFMPHRTTAIIAGIVNGAYAVSRGIAKQGVPYNG